MSMSVKRFRLRDPSMSNAEIAKRLGHAVRHGYANSNPTMKVVFTVDLRWVGSRVNRDVFTLHISETELHQAARQFADEIGES